MNDRALLGHVTKSSFFNIKLGHWVESSLYRIKWIVLQISHDLYFDIENSFFFITKSRTGKRIALSMKYTHILIAMKLKPAWFQEGVNWCNYSWTKCPSTKLLPSAKYRTHEKSVCISSYGGVLNTIHGIHKHDIISWVSIIVLSLMKNKVLA